jgi:nucleoside-diphosphate-sugar epimerase
MIDWQGRRVLVTGGAGFIGSHLVDRLVELGARVRVLDDFSTGREDNIHRRRIGSLAVAEQSRAITVISATIEDAGICRKACDEVEIVFHQAALANVPESLREPGACIGVNVAGTATLFEAARDAKVQRVVYASSSAVYGNGRALRCRPEGYAEHEGEEGCASSPYALSKQMNEQLADMFASCYEMEFVGLRYFNVYGPRQIADSGAVVPCFLRAAAASAQLVINGDGGQTRDYVHVSDVVEANLLAAAAPLAVRSAAFNVGTGRAVSLNTLAKLISNRPALHADARPDEARHSVADLTRARNALGYLPKVALEDGIGQMMAVPR